MRTQKEAFSLILRGQGRLPRGRGAQAGTWKTNSEPSIHVKEQVLRRMEFKAVRIACAKMGER